MDTLNSWRQTIENVLGEYASIPYAYGDIQTEVISDRENDHYLLVNVGWRESRRIYGSLVHIAIIDGKIWVQQDGTEDGIANELVEGGIPRDMIVLGFRAPEVRQFTGFAMA